MSGESEWRVKKDQEGMGRAQLNSRELEEHGEAISALKAEVCAGHIDLILI